MTMGAQRIAAAPWRLICVVGLMLLCQCRSFMVEIFPRQLTVRWNMQSALAVSLLVDTTRSIEDKQSYWSMQPTTSVDTTSKLWKQLCPPLWNPKDTKDATVVWSCCDDAENVATELLRRLDPSSRKIIHPAMVETLAESLDQFRTFCMTNLHSTRAFKSDDTQHGHVFKARIVATRGTSGTKCPQWHIDHVPVRWIQSLVGPGCELVTGNTQQSIHWNLVNGLNAEDDGDDDHVIQDSARDRNQALVREDVAEIHAGREGEALLLVGNRWNDYAKDSTPVQPVVHKSPTIPWGCERVLLTQDMVLDD